MAHRAQENAATQEPSSSNASTEGNARRRRRKPKQESHVVAAYVQSALREKQREDEQLQVAQRRRRKRAVHKSKKRNPLRDEGDKGTDRDACGDSHTGRDGQTGGCSDADMRGAAVVVVENLVDIDELQDSDEYDDVVADLESDFSRYGGCTSLQVAKATGVVTLVFADHESAAHVVDAKHGKVFGGREVVARLVLTDEDGSHRSERLLTGMAENANPVSDHAIANRALGEDSPRVHHIAPRTQTRNTRRSKCKNAVLREREKKQEKTTSSISEDRRLLRTFLVRNLVQSDEIEDEDEYEEIESETASDFGRFGELAQLRIVRDMDDRQQVSSSSPTLVVGDVVVEYQDHACASSAFCAYDGKTFGGRLVECRWFQNESKAISGEVQVENMLAPDELQDPDEYEDIRGDVMQIFHHYGNTESLEICRDTGSIRVTYQSTLAAQQVVEKMNRTVYGGRTVRVYSVEDKVQGCTGLCVESKQDRPARTVRHDGMLDRMHLALEPISLSLHMRGRSRWNLHSLDLQRVFSSVSRVFRYRHHRLHFPFAGGSWKRCSHTNSFLLGLCAGARAPSEPRTRQAIETPRSWSA